MTVLRTLMFEDAEDDAALIARQLRTCGCEVNIRCVATREDLLQALDEDEWDLAVVGRNRRGFGGLQALDTLRERGFGGAVIMLSGATGEDSAVECNAAGSMAVINEITERKQAEERSHGSEARLRALFDASPDGIVAADLDLRIVNCNEALATMAGAETIADVVGLGVLDLIAAESRDAVVANFQRVVTDGPVRSIEYEAVDLNGRRFPIEVSANAIMNDQCEPEGVVATVIDITERRESERELQELAQFRRSIIDQANIWLHVLDRELNTVVWNPAAAEISGVSAGEALHNRTAWQVLHPDPAEREEVFEIAREVIEEGRVLENEEVVIHTRGGGERTISWNARRLLDQQGEPIGMVAMGRDITEGKQLERQLRQAVKMEAIGRLAGGIAHDFNNMLTAILGNVQLLQMHMDARDENQRMLNEIRIAARRSADLTRQLLAFSRKQAMDPEAIDLNVLVERLEPMLERMIGEQIAVLTNLDPDLGLIEADPSQIDQVLMNLVVNARDAMPDGGTLTIETANTVLDEHYARANADFTPGPYVVLSVSDTGVGMDAETQERIFEPFFTTKGADEGTGLGLATVYGIVNQSGGHIHVYSEEGAGTVFTIYLPRTDADALVKAQEQPEHEDLHGKETILLVEDEEIVRNLIAGVLRRHGHSVIAAGSGDEALKKLAEHDREIDLLVSDVIMPGMSGAELADAIAEIQPQVPVIFVSGYTEQHIVRHGVLEDGVHYMQKPFDPPKLLRRIRSVLNG